jgi:hypothetical protein
MLFMFINHTGFITRCKIIVGLNWAMLNYIFVVCGKVLKQVVLLSGDMLISKKTEAAEVWPFAFVH